MIFDHLKHYFSMSMESYSCEECKVGFIHGADLRRHQRSADDGDCSFRFHHIDDCTGHHPPGRDHLNMWDKLRHWEQCQLQSYVLSVEMLRSRRLGALYTRSDSSAACRACQILRFFNDQFSEQFEGTYLTHLKAHRDSTVDQTSLSHDIAASQIDEMIRTLSGRYRRATSAATTTAGTKTYPEMENKTSYNDAKIRRDIFKLQDKDFVDVSYLFNPLQGTLHWAACAGDCITVEYCINNGADIHGVDLGGRTAVHWAAASGSAQTLGLLLEHGGSVEPKDIDEQTPLAVAIAHRSIECVELLLSQNNIDTMADEHTEAFLRTAGQAGDVAIVKLLLGHGCDINAGDWFGQTPLLLAVKGGRLDVVEALCDLGAAIELSDDSERTPLMSSIDLKAFEVAHYLLGRGATVTADIVALASRREASDDFVSLLKARVGA